MLGKATVRAIRSTHLFVGLAMLVTASLVVAMTSRQAADQGPEISLEAMIPEQFGEWRLDGSIVSLAVSPVNEALLEKIYSETLARNYINEKGERIMLSIAYGGRQSTTMQVHRPEMCYPAQGFAIGSVSQDFIDFSGSRLPVMKLVATQGRRIEPITYWVMIGDSAVRGGLEQSLARVKYGLSGKVPYGMVIRVSTISADEQHSYRVEERFVRDMLGAMPTAYRKILTGTGE